MSAIDYKAESERIMSLLGENVIALEGQTDATTIASAIDALRCATLYAGDQTADLAKQQRIANVLFLARMEGEGGGTDRATLDSVFEDVGEGFDITRSVRPEIRDGLGLS